MDFGIEIYDSLYTEETPNPETMKFIFDKLLIPGKSIDFPTDKNVAISPLAEQLFTFPYVKSVFIASNFLTVTKKESLKNWDDAIPELKQFLKEYVEGGSPIIDKEEMEKQRNEITNDILPGDDDVIHQIKYILDKRVAPAVEMDGGAIEFIKFEDGILYLNMEGACNHCPSSMVTLKQGIERIMQKNIPAVKEVVGIDNE